MKTGQYQIKGGPISSLKLKQIFNLHDLATYKNHDLQPNKKPFLHLYIYVMLLTHALMQVHTYCILSRDLVTIQSQLLPLLAKNGAKN